ncbi:MAG: hypothetical protein KGL39_26530 [Patescibacteria group bacterium]|nr:hypothetical protein [Patescibacteria group bacterium]
MSYVFNEVELREKLDAVGVTLAVDPAVGYRFPLLRSDDLYPLGVVIATSQGFEALVAGIYRPVSDEASEAAFIDFVVVQVTPPNEQVAPDCRDQKHRICDGQSWSNTADRRIACVCDCHKSEKVAA